MDFATFEFLDRPLALVRPLDLVQHDLNVVRLSQSQAHPSIQHEAQRQWVFYDREHIRSFHCTR